MNLAVFVPVAVMAAMDWPADVANRASHTGDPEEYVPVTAADVFTIPLAPLAAGPATYFACNWNGATEQQKTMLLDGAAQGVWITQTNGTAPAFWSAAAELGLVRVVEEEEE